MSERTVSTQNHWSKSFIVVVVAAFLSAAPCARADILTWQGNISADWFVAGNWIGGLGGAPASIDKLTLNTGTPEASVGTTVTTDLGGSITLNNFDSFSSAAFDNLVIGLAGSGTVTVDGADFSANTVTINGIGSKLDVQDTFFQFFVGNLTASNSGNFGVNLAVTDAPALIVDTASFNSGASMTVSSGTAAMTSLTLQGVGTAYQGTAGGVETASLTLSDGASVNISGSHNLNVTGTTTIGAGANPVTLSIANPVGFRTGTLVLSGGQLNTPNGLVVNDLSGFGTLQGPIAGDSFAQITATGSLALGDANSFLGFNYNGSLDAGINTVALNAAGFANLGVLTTLSSGTLAAANGVALGVGDNISGSGQVNAKIAASSGSTIEATGSLVLGDATKVDGFFSDGQLLTQANTVTINDANVIVLGSLTRLGDGVSTGGLIAGTALTSDTAPHFLVEEGKNLVGRGNIAGNFKNNGAAIGDGTATLAERLVFDAPWTVSGKGTFINTAVFGTFSPGESPGISNTTDQLFGGTVEIELGGTTPGNGSDNHDQIKDTGTIFLANNPTLSILTFNNFLPTVGNEFEILTWQTALDGTFGNILVDPFFINNGIDFDPIFTNTGGPGSLTLRAITFIPEPSTATIVILMAMGLPIMRRRTA